MKCKVVLHSDGQTQNFSCVGELILNEKSFSLSYTFGPDICFLTYDGEILRHEKKGEIPVSIEFVSSGKTLCKIGSDGFSGEIPVYTNSLEVRVCDGNISIEIVYELGGENKQMKISAVWS